MRKEKGRKKKDARVRYEDGGAEVHKHLNCRKKEKVLCKCMLTCMRMRKYIACVYGCALDKDLMCYVYWDK
jgi:hypothetical protein